MRNAYIKNISGEVDTIPAYELIDFPWILLPEKKLKVYRKKTPKTYLKVFGAFDIETTTIQAGRPYGFMWHWQICLGGVCAYGRDWKSWVDFMLKAVDWFNINIENRLVIYVHNLAFELQFIRDFLNKYFGGFTVFAAQTRKPMHVITENGIEFRCSYKLTNMSLEKALENEKGVEHLKMAGDLDYRIKRLPSTEITDVEFSYNIADVLGLYEFIKCRMKNDKDDLSTIPLTSTGYVRRDLKKATRKAPNYREYFKKNYMSIEVYKLLKKAGRGGNTHANRYLSGRIWNNVCSFDVRSSYPAMILLKDFPVKKFYYYGNITSMEELDSLCNEKPCLFNIAFKNLRVKPTTTMPYISYSKNIGMISDTITNDNGRIIKGTFAITITDIDYKIIKDQYTWDAIAISDFYTSEYGKLPECIRQTTLDYYLKKQELAYKISLEKDPEKKADLKYLYAKSKNKLNSIFGCMYTDPVRAIIEIDNKDDWTVKRPDLEEALDTYNNSRNSFLIYAHGVWITAHARAHLQRLLDVCGQNAIYTDTDSCKTLEMDFSGIDKLNEDIMTECEKLGAFVDVGGIRYHLGIYERENVKPYPAFITLGAKKYAYIDESGLHTVISGVNKKLGAQELGKIENFKPGFIFKAAGGTTHYYNDDKKIYKMFIDGELIETASNIGIVESTYEIGITREYAKLIKYNVIKESIRG